MKEVSIIGVDLAKQVFQLHGATINGEVVFRKKLSRKQFVVFMEAHSRCCVAMEACATGLPLSGGPISVLMNDGPRSLSSATIPS